MSIKNLSSTAAESPLTKKPTIPDAERSAGARALAFEVIIPFFKGF